MSTHKLPSYTGYIETPLDALLVITACLLGMLPRVQRKLLEPEKLMFVKSGAVFVCIEEESHIHRWTDTRSWSASRQGPCGGGLLLYREMTKRGGGRMRTVGAIEMRRPSRYECPARAQARACVKDLAGSLLNHGELDELIRRGESGPPKRRDEFKRGGLMKKTFSLKMPGEKWHLIAYYSLEDALAGHLKTPRESHLFRGMSVNDIPGEIREAYFNQRNSGPLSPSSSIAHLSPPSTLPASSPPPMFSLSPPPSTFSASPPPSEFTTSPPPSTFSIASPPSIGSLSMSPSQPSAILSTDDSRQLDRSNMESMQVPDTFVGSISNEITWDTLPFQMYSQDSELNPPPDASLFNVGDMYFSMSGMMT